MNAAQQAMHIHTMRAFANKAHIVNGNMLISYTTHVASVVDGVFQRHWDGYSLTTMRHINAFREMHGLSYMNKQEWLALEVV